MILDSEVTGFQVFNFKNKNVGSVKKVVWRALSEKIDGFYITKNKLIQLNCYLPFSSVKKIGDRKVVLIKNYKTASKTFPPLGDVVCMGDKKYFLGGFNFDEKTGSVKSVKIAKSIYEDLKNGREEKENFRIKNGLIFIDRR